MSFSTLSPEAFPLQPAKLADLRGGDRDVNAGIICAILRGQERGPKRDAVLLNAAAALFVADRVRNLAEGWDLAAQVIDGGLDVAAPAEAPRPGREHQRETQGAMSRAGRRSSGWRVHAVQL